jgi:hypothetical protein
VVDSIAGMTTENEDASDYEKEGFATDKAIILSKSMRKLTNLLGRERILLLFTNQVRDNVGVMYGDKFVTPGGKAVPFHSSVRVELRKSKSIVETVKGQRSQIGAQIRPKVTKNRMGPPGRKCEFDLYFSSGIDDPGSFYDKLKAHGAIKHKGGGWYKLKARDSDAEDWYHEDGDLFTFRKNDSDDEDAFFRVVNRNKPFRELCFEHLYENEIMTYDKDWTGSANKEYADAEDADPREAGQAGLSDQTRSEEAEEAGA